MSYKNWQSGEDVQYTYDSLARLTKAETLGPDWGQSFGYDGWGNLLSKSVTKGSAPVMSVTADPASNRLVVSGMTYDSNGNVTNMPGVGTLAYDARNRITGSGGVPTRGYDPGNRKIWWKDSNGLTFIDYWLPNGEKLVTYRVDEAPYSGAPAYTGPVQFLTVTRTLYFGGRQVKVEGRYGVGGYVEWPQPDRLSSNTRHHPYGEERGTSSTEYKFATYQRESSGLDYALNRYYSSVYGRFVSSDPYRASGGPRDPGSWNRYVYVQGDPVNSNDPKGLEACPVSTPTSVTVCATPDPVPFNFWAEGCSNCSTTVPDSQTDYESGACSNEAGVPCYQVDIGRRKLNAIGSEYCSLSMFITMECGGDSTGRYGAIGGSMVSRLAGSAAMAWWAAAQAVGRAAEALVGSVLKLPKNELALKGSTRIPDFVNAATKTLYEVKNTSYVSFTAQLRDMSDWAITNNYTFQLWVNKDTELSSGVQKAVDSGLIQLYRFTWP